MPVFRSRRALGVAAALLASVSAGASALEGAQSAQPRPTTAILVDKATNTLQLVEYRGGAYHPLKTFHATLGKALGDKEREGDLRTPEGIYTFKSVLKPPSLRPKFGAMAFNIDYPNTFDRMSGRTGSAIMLHATDTPERLKLDYDSEGCVVIENGQIREIESGIRLGLTPILIFPELTEQYRNPGRDAGLKAFFDGWIRAWESRDVEEYIRFYHSGFSAKGMDRSRWKTYKSGLTRMYSSIRIGPEDVRIYSHPKYSMITFTQNYESKRQGGGWGHRSRGTKILYVGREAGDPKIIAETYTDLMW